MRSDSTEHQDLLQFLYAAPVGLVHTALDGRILSINAAAARWLMPLSVDGRLDNLFDLLASKAPGLRQAAKDFKPVAGLIQNDLRLEMTGGRWPAEGAEYASITLTKLSEDRLTAALSDVTQQVRDERALADATAHYRAVVSVLSEGIVVHGMDGTLLSCNAAAQRILGDVLAAGGAGSDLMAAWAPRWPDGRPMRFEDTPTGVVLGGGPAQERVPVCSVAEGGERRWFDVSAQAVVRPHADTPLAVVTSITDVTQRELLLEQLQVHRAHLEELVAQRTKELEASNESLAGQQKLLSTVADAVPGMVGYWDAELRCRFANIAYLEWFGRTQEQMRGIRMQDLMGEALFALNEPHVKAALQGHPQHFQRSIRKPDGTVGHTLASYIPDRAHGRVLGINVVVSDVTDLKQAELRLEALNRELAQRVLQADSATRAKSAFLANMSHEIRTPMNAIIGLAHLMQRDGLGPGQHERLGKINDASQHLLQVINDILDLSKIEAGKLPLDHATFVTDDVLRRAFSMVAAQASAKSLELVLESGPLPRRLKGDAVRLSQCLINLLGNAVKFTDAGWVCLRSELLAREGGHVRVRFEVQDTGTGIDIALQGQLFKAFEQADNSPTRAHGGTGLGLALTRHLAQLMGGDAGVQSGPGAGSTFWFTARFEVVAEAAAEVALAPMPGLKALLLDDLPTSLNALQKGLNLIGLEVDAQPGGLQALQRLDATQDAGSAYDLVLIDKDMPLLDGFEALSALRQRLPAAAPPALLLSTVWDADLEQQARAAGFDGVVVKPVTTSELHEAVVRVLRGGHSPALAVEDAPEDAEARLRQAHAGQSVLLVEDNLVNQEVAFELLEIVGLVVETANNGQQAVELMRSRRFDVVLMDVQMPVMDGLVATREIRRMESGRTPIVAMTANAFSTDHAECLAAGMDDHVAKPVDPDLLYSALLRWLPRPPATAAAGV